MSGESPQGPSQQQQNNQQRNHYEPGGPAQPPWLGGGPAGGSGYGSPNQKLPDAATPGPRSGLPTAAMILGIVALVLSWIPFLGILLALVAMVFAIVVLARKLEPRIRGIIGIVAGSFAFLVAVTLTIVALVLLSGFAHGSNSSALGAKSSISASGQSQDKDSQSGDSSPGGPTEDSSGSPNDDDQDGSEPDAGEGSRSGSGQTGESKQGGPNAFVKDGPQQMELIVSSSEPVNIYYFAGDDSANVNAKGNWSKVVEVNSSKIGMMSVESSDLSNDVEITCEIQLDGKTVDKHEQTGFVDCSFGENF